MSPEPSPTTSDIVITDPSTTFSTALFFSTSFQTDPSLSSLSCVDVQGFDLDRSEAASETGNSSRLEAAECSPWNTQQSQPSIQQHEDLPLPETNEATLCARLTSIDEFFAKNGAHRPPLPCSYCRSLRLQCLILRTTTANPNPIESCSSCVALYRDCSLAERTKRKAQFYETALPVIGHLHGVAEEIGAPSETKVGDDIIHQPHEQGELQSAADTVIGIPALREQSSAQSMRRTGALRNWFAAHSDHPYPTDEEKVTLASQCGLSKTQVVNWFINARRRHRLMAHSYLDNGGKVFSRGSPMPQSFLVEMSPMERWENSPPSEDHVSQAVVEEAISESKIRNGIMSQPSRLLDQHRSYALDGAPSSASGESDLCISDMQRASSNSTSSALSFYHSDDGTYSLSSTQSVGHSNQYAARKRQSAIRQGTNLYQCTFCHQSFKRKYDWVRHERSIHLPGLACWVCVPPIVEGQSFLVWRIGRDHSECIFCGQASPTDEHIQSHEFQLCEERPISERTFSRKDHLWQHLRKVHGCRRWEGWKPHLRVLERQREDMKGQCGFCQVTTTTWNERVEHLAGHFRGGATMADWTGDSGLQM